MTNQERIAKAIETLREVEPVYGEPCDGEVAIRVAHEALDLLRAIEPEPDQVMVLRPGKLPEPEWEEPGENLDAGKKLSRLMSALAEHTAEASDDEILEEAGDKSAEAVRKVLSEASSVFWDGARKSARVVQAGLEMMRPWYEPYCDQCGTRFMATRATGRPRLDVELCHHCRDIERATADQSTRAGEDAATIERLTAERGASVCLARGTQARQGGTTARGEA